MEFKEFKELLQQHVSKIFETQETLFVTAVDRDNIWETYLDSFPEGTNNVFKERREFDCSCCRQFVKSFGNVVAIKDNKLISIWDFDTGDSKYQPVIEALSKLVKSENIKDVLITKESGFGTDYNFEKLENEIVNKWEHFRIDLPKKFVSRSSKSEASVMSDLKSINHVFARSLNEISKDSVETVLELIAQKSLYKGEEWEGALTKFLSIHNEYHAISGRDQENYCWAKSVEVGGSIGKIKNHSIGVLLIDITEGVDLNVAVKRYEAIVAPSNYKRPKAIFTKKMIEQAQSTISELGFLNSLPRRHAAIDDITVNNILFANKDAAKAMTGDVFEDLKSDAKVSQKSFDKLEEIPIEKFVKDILPGITDMEIFVENKQSANFMSLIAPVNKESKSMLKWDNNFSWAYNGNIADSMKERVKSMGGKVDGVLRFSIQWNDKGDNSNDFDAHCVEPGGHLIYYGDQMNRNTKGNLDVDIQNPRFQINNRVAVENITWPDINLMEEGVYHFLVHNYSDRGGQSGFSAEIEYDGEIHSFEYRDRIRNDQKITVAKVEFSKTNSIKFIESLPSSISSKKVWNVDTQKFHPVSVFMNSPNYWDGQSGVGHKHYFFMLNNCKNEDRPNGFFNEFLKEDLMEHKRVFEALGSKMKVEQSDNQLSGLGFSSTQKNTLIVKIKGSFKRTVKLIF